MAVRRRDPHLVAATVWVLAHAPLPVAGARVVELGCATGRVLSPVCVTGADGAPTPVDLGPVAMLDRAAALEALAAARAAWDHGRGAWPTMRVGERIERMQTFVAGMRAVREDLVRLLMLEIGKTRADSETEVDRTAIYIDDTIAALKDLDRTAARFTVTGGFVGQIRRSPAGW